MVSCLRSAHQASSEKGSNIKGKDLLEVAFCSLLESISSDKGGKTHFDRVASPAGISSPCNVSCI